MRDYIVELESQILEECISMTAGNSKGSNVEEEEYDDDGIGTFNFDNFRFI